MAGRQRAPSEREGVERLAFAVIGSAIEVHRLLGPGYLEAVYEEALCHELVLRGIAFERQHPVAVPYKGLRVGEARLDVFVEGKLVVELKATDALLPIHAAQTLSYLKATGCRFALLINFNVPALRQGIKRLVL